MSLPAAVATLLTLSVLATVPVATSTAEPSAAGADDRVGAGGAALSPSGRGAAPSSQQPGGPVPVLGPAWVWPLDPQPAVVRGFVLPEERWLSGHRGVDLLVAGEGAVAGGPVRTPADGRLRFVGPVAGKPVVVVEHAGGLRSTFEPVTSGLALGALLTRGQVVGAVTDTPGHCAPRTCLHWGVLRGDTYLDPLALLGPRNVRLLPLH